MKLNYYIPAVLGIFFLLIVNSGAQTQHTQPTQQAKSDSLPEGFTDDKIKDLRDDKGRKIFAEDEGDAFQLRSFNGFAAGDLYGSSVSSAGDVNGDGYDDIIIGAPLNDAQASNAGRAYIYFGGVNVNSSVDVILTGEATNNNFGKSVSTAGDVNGDGYSDVIVGADYYSGATGKAYIFYGGSSMNNIANVIMTGETTDNYFGGSVSTAGDVNGDGYPDVGIGAYGYSSFKGRTYIYFGGSSMNNIADVTITGGATNDYFGISVSTAGDVNGDGYSDIVAGAYGYSSFTGRAYVFYGGVSMNNIVDQTMTGAAIDNNFGVSVSSAGDVNGDGYSDIVIGAEGYNSFTGRAYVYYGGASMNNIADVIMTGEATNNYFGTSVSKAGDVNGDGNLDVIIGAFGYDADLGRAYVYYGGTSMNNVADLTITGDDTYTFPSLGNSVSSAGDVNKDGYSDLIIGSNIVNSLAGRVYLYMYSMTGIFTPELTNIGEAVSNYYGNSISTAGDVNGDGYADVIAGAPGNNSHTGKAYIYFGGENMNNVADITIVGATTSNSFGYSVSTAGDVNGDGYSDVIVGASGYSNSGRAYIFFGGTNMNNVSDVTMTGEVNSEFGSAVSTAGDVNNDGYSDVIVGANVYNNNTGRAYIFFGGVNMNNLADVTMTGLATYTYFGCSVSTAGDLNNDGYSDVIIGADGNPSIIGMAYVFYGGAIMNNITDITLTGSTTGDFFGVSVATAGDVNGDGISDVIVGALGYLSGEGAAYIYFGSMVMDNNADIYLTGDRSPLHTFGRSVSSAGDINKDGYSDVIVGEEASATGKAHIFYGGVVMNNTADVILTDEGTNTTFGNSVSTAGDLNKDGYPDLIVSAPYFNTATGKSFIYMTSSPNVHPNILSIKDVPFDQGGKLNLNFARSGYDVIGINRITDYLIQRSLPPAGGNYSWQNVANVIASKEPYYTYTDNTPNDSTSNSSGTFFYRITARTADPNEFWRSNILSGKSIDNIPPLFVDNFSAVYSSGNVLLNWTINIEPDLYNYLIYRSTSQTIDPNVAIPYATVTASSYTDTSPLNGLYYYFIVAQDIHNNKSPVSSVTSPNITLSLNLFIQGFYNAATNLQISDTIKVYLRNSTAPFAKVDSAKSVLSSGGNANLIFGNAPSGIYYIIAKHRNSIETWSRAGGESLNRGGSVNYNLSNLITQAYGSNIKQIDTSPVRFGIYSGDENQDGIVDAADVLDIYNDVNHLIAGYVKTDLNGDNFVDVSDLIIAFNNANNIVGVITP